MQIKNQLLLAVVEGFAFLLFVVSICGLLFLLEQ